MNNSKIIVHYCCGTYYYGAIGGVARYDYQISLAFPNRMFVQGPQQKNQLLQFLNKNKGNVIVITDNHLACDIPNEIPTILVHHGCAKTTAIRNPDWGEPWKSLCTQGQNKMLTYRDPKTTKIISISQACTDDFIKYYGKEYTKFERIPVLHPSELDEKHYKTTFNKNPIVLGNWEHIKKGQKLIPILKKNIPNFQFQQLSVGLNGNHPNVFDDFNKQKQDIYLQSDIFLQISNSEGNSYATLDALICGLPVVSSNVGLFYNDVPEDCFVKLEWERNGDSKYVQEKLEYAWEHREKLSKNARKWYMDNCRFEDWINKMKEIVFK
jgi:glycosyltransferase involved in cell wall biosynthesis